VKLKDMEFIELLPVFMRKDAANIGLSKGVDKVIKMFAAYGWHLSVWPAIDDLTEDELDELAWELNITWCERSADLEAKRKIIKGSDEVKRNLGTGWAVEQIISAYFGSGYIEEWFEYDGEPGHFKVFSSNPSITQENLNKFLRILEKVKRKSAHLETISIGLTGKNYLRTGIGCHDAEIVSIRVKRGSIEGWENQQMTGTAAHESTTCVAEPYYDERN
jgi:P2-related tail formation protein